MGLKEKFFVVISIVVITACSRPSKQQQQIDSIIALEQSKHTYEELGEPQAVISFGVITNDRKTFVNGIVPWASLANPEEDLPQLVSKDMVVIYDTVVTVVIDYPLTNPYEFRLISPDGFTRGQLLTEISNQYKFVYTEEEKTATVKTLPVEQREILNRNTTNGKYGIWGHDLTDLDLSEIHVHKAPDGRIVLLLQVES